MRDRAPAGEEPALYVADGDRFVPTELSQGPWAPDLQFGGAPAALLAETIGSIPTLVPQRVARLTIDLMRPVPLRPLRVEHRVVREGKRIQLSEAAVVADEVIVARASALRFRVGELGDVGRPAGRPWPGPPPDPDPNGPFQERGVVPGVARASQFSVTPGGALLVDPTWIRLAVPVVAGRLTSGLARLAFTADFVSGIGHPRGEPLTGINADITLNVVRDPVGEWLCVTGHGWISPDGIGHSQAELADAEGVAASATLARLVDRVEEPD